MPFKKGFKSWLGKKRKPFSKEWKGKISKAVSLANKGKPKSEEHKRKLSEANIGKRMSEGVKAKISNSCKVKAKRGKGHFNWKGGITPENEKIRGSKEYAEWRTSVFERDDYRCQDCGARNGEGVNVYLEADHIKPFALYPELRFELSNGKTLCKPCHIKTPTYGRRTEKIRENGRAGDTHLAQALQH